MSLIQKAKGTGSTATFASPTTAGSTIVVVCTNNNQNEPGFGEISGCTDDKSQNYYHSTNFIQKIDAEQPGCSATTFVSEGPSVADMTTVTVGTATDSQVWIYELTTPESVPSYDTNTDIEDSNSGASASPTGNGLVNENAFGTEHWYFYACAVGGNGGTVTAVGDGWTLDDVQAGNAVAYIQGTGDKNVTFTADSSVGFAVAGMSIYGDALTTGKIIVHKATDPDTSEQRFAFTPSWGLSAPFSLGNGETEDSGPLDPGTYSIVETAIPGWTTAVTVGGDPQDPAAIVVGEGQTVDVTFTNTMSHVVVRKVSVPSSSTQDFTFHASWATDPFTRP